MTKIYVIVPKENETSLKRLLKNTFSSEELICVAPPVGHKTSKVKNLIEEDKPDGVLLAGTAAISAVFPNAPSTVHNAQGMRGCKIPFYTKNGNAIPCVILKGSKPKDSNEKELLISDALQLKEENDFLPFLSPKIIICKTFPQIQECVKKLKEEKVVAWDFETTQKRPYPQAGKVSKLYSVSFAFMDGTTYAIPLFDFFPQNIQNAVMEVIREFFFSLNPTQKKIAHNAKFDILWGLVGTGCGLEKEPKGDWEDTSFLCWMNDERQKMSGLKVACWRYLGVDDWSVDVKNVRSLPLDDVLHYNALDSFYTLRLFQYLEPKVLKSERDENVYRNVLLPAMLQFLKVEIRGVPVDEEKRFKLYQNCKKIIDDLTRKARQISGNIDLSPTSSQNLTNYFLGKGYKFTKRTPSGALQMDQEVLEDIVEKHEDEVAKIILEVKKYVKLQSTYIEGLTKDIFTDKRLHGSYNLTATETGRTSSNNPNMQNFPKRKNKEVREIVKAPKGYKLCSFDYGQIEARLFAVVTGDEKYLEDLYNGYDIHTEKALWIYKDNLGWSEEEAKKKRSEVKNQVFAVFYGAVPATIASSLKISEDLAQGLVNSILERYSSIPIWQKALAKEEAKFGFITSLFGRKRRGPMSWNQLLNFIFQSSASDMTLTAMNNLGRKYDVAMMIHDDDSFFLPDDEKLEENINYIMEAMLVLPWLYIHNSPRVSAYAPLQVECEIGDNWGQLSPYKKVDSLENGFKDIESCLERAKIIKSELEVVGW